MYSEKSIDGLYLGICEKVGKGCNLSFFERKKLRKNNIAKLVALTPFLAKSDYPERDGVLSLSTYIVATKTPSVSSTKVGELIEGRMAPLFAYSVQDKKVFKKCKNMLYLASLYDHIHDLKSDEKVGKYNPLSNKSEEDIESIKTTFSTGANTTTTLDTEISYILSKEEIEAGVWRV